MILVLGQKVKKKKKSISQFSSNNVFENYMSTYIMKYISWQG